MAAEDDDAIAESWCFKLMPSDPLPIVNLSRSLKSRYLPHSVLPKVDRFLHKYHYLLLTGYITSLTLIIATMLMDAPSGQTAALFSMCLGLPLGLGSIGSLRYDVVRLLLRTYDFWFFFIVLTATLLVVAVVFSDVRILQLFIIWSGFQNVVLIDAQVRGIRQLIMLISMGIIVLFTLLITVMLNRVDSAHVFSLFQYSNRLNQYTLSASDVVGNGLTTMGILLAKIVYRKRKSIRPRKKTSVIECAIYRCRVQLVSCTPPRLTPVVLGPTFPLQPARIRLRRPSFLQQMRFVNVNLSYDARNILFPVKIISKLPFPGYVLAAIYIPAVCGIVITFVAVVYGSSSTADASSDCMIWSSVGLLFTVCATTCFGALYQRQLLKSLITSFDFTFYSVQWTSAHVCICVLYNWRFPHCLAAAALWLWIHWILTLDALTPIMRAKLHFHIRFAIPVMIIFVLSQMVILYGVLFSGPNDHIIWEGGIWGHHVQIRVVPFLFSRLITMVLWASRVIWRFMNASNVDMTLLLGAVTYENYLAKPGRKVSRVQPTGLQARRRLLRIRSVVPP